MKTSPRHIDREVDKPPYIQLVQILREKIEKGEYLPGDRLPSETELCKQFKVSRMTVRRCIQSLLEQQLISTIKGSGTYVKALNIRGGTFSMEDFYKIFEDQERTKVRILEVQVIRADAEAAKKLRLRKGDRTIQIRRLLIRDGDPIIYHQGQLVYDPVLRIVEAEMEVTSLLGLFEGKGETMLKWGELVIELAVLTKEEADLLNTLTHQPAFQLEHIFYDFSDRPVSWGKFICRGDRFRFTTTVGITNKRRI